MGNIFTSVWFWLVIVGILLLIVGIFILILSSVNKTLGYIALAFGIITLLAGIIYGVFSKGSSAINVGEQDIQLRTQFGKTLESTAKDYNREVDTFFSNYIDTDYTPKMKKYAQSAGELTGSIAGAGVKGIGFMTI